MFGFGGGGLGYSSYGSYGSYGSYAISPTQTYYSAPGTAPVPPYTGASSTGSGDPWWKKLAGAVGDFIGYEVNRARNDAERIVDAGTTAARNEAYGIAYESSPVSMYVTAGLALLVVILLVVVLMRRK